MKNNETIKFIESQGKWGMKLGLETIGKLLNKLNSPQNDQHFIHVAGSNGKGSICKILETSLLSNDYRVGTYTSPALEHFSERIRVNGNPIEQKDIDRLFRSIHKAGQELQEEGGNYPTAFEIETAMALLYFKEQQCDVSIMEVGLGGRLDATNIIPSPEVAVISNISLEHTKYLGDTLDQIAREKAAIIKDGTDVVISDQEEEALSAIIETAEQNNANSITVIDPVEIVLRDERLGRQDLSYNSYDFKFGLNGDYQRNNLLSALKALERLNERGFDVEINKALDSLESLNFPGRLEILNTSPLILIDGAHNISGITNLVRNIKTYLPEKKVDLYFGMIREKNVVDSLKELLTISKQINLVEPDSPDAIPNEELKELIQSLSDVPVRIYSEYQEAVDSIDLNKKDTIYLFTGSLYMIGKVRSLITKKIKSR